MGCVKVGEADLLVLLDAVDTGEAEPPAQALSRQRKESNVTERQSEALREIFAVRIKHLYFLADEKRLIEQSPSWPICTHFSKQVCKRFQTCL